MSIQSKINEMLAEMTVEEKVAQMLQVAYIDLTKEEAERYARLGVGSFLHVWGEDAKRLQDIACSLGHKIPLLFGVDAIHGHALNRRATIFPTQLSMACSFNPELVEAMATVSAKEVAADGLHWTFSPVLCLGRDIRWGRIGETFGEDQYLSAELGGAMIRGYQGEDLSQKGRILACAKHYIGYGEATGARDSYDTEITYRKLRSDFLLPFEYAVKEGCATIMTAYGSIDGTPCTADKKLLTDILKNELGFSGFVVTDWDNVAHLISDQFVANNVEEAVSLALSSGNDMMMRTLDFYETTVKLVKENKIDLKVIDEAVRRILKVKAQLGLFENACKWDDDAVIGCNAHQEINKKLARESVVLLKNDGILPLSRIEGKKIAVIGPHGDAIRDLLGHWTYFTHPTPNYDTLPERPYYTLVEGLKEVGKNAQIEYVKGCGVNEEIPGGIDKSLDLAKKCDIVIFAFGDNVWLNGEGNDIANPALTMAQTNLFNALTKTGKPIISVMIASKPLCVPEVVEKSNAFLTGFNLGAFGGLALSEVIFGVVNPSAKLPISFPYHIGQQPCYYNGLPGWHSNSYVDMPKEPLFVFGEGLSYTKFSYKDINFEGETWKLTFLLKNEGDIKGKEIVQVYIRDKVSSVITPIKKLVAFRKVELAPKEERIVEFFLSARDFSLVNREEKRVVEKGEFEILVGGSSKMKDLLKIDYIQAKDIIL